MTPKDSVPFRITPAQKQPNQFSSRSRRDELLWSAIRGEPVGTIAHYVVLRRLEENVTAVLVSTATALSPYRYVVAKDYSEHHYYLALPAEWGSTYSELVKHLEHATDCPMKFLGGGTLIDHQTSFESHGLSYESALAEPVYVRCVFEALLVHGIPH